MAASINGRYSLGFLFAAVELSLLCWSRSVRRRRALKRVPPDARYTWPSTPRQSYFGGRVCAQKTLRIHVPVETNASVHMVAGGLCYSMQPDEVWVLNNSATHAVWNAHPTLARTHMICDFLPSPALSELLRSGERNLGTHLAHVDQYFKDAHHAKAAADPHTMPRVRLPCSWSGKYR